jgi:ABC-type dipeptide/oligopeptide/nickel transport system ATPase component
MAKKSKKFELVNIYEKDAIKPFLLTSHNPNYDVHFIQIPFRMLIIGSSGSGKTMTLYNILRVFSKTFQNIYIITKNKKESIYEYIEDKFKKINEKPKAKFHQNVNVEEGIDMLPDLETFDKEEQSLVVLNDLVLLKDQSRIVEYYVRCRKLNVSVIYISQSYFAIPKIIRQNVNYVIIKQVSSARNLKMIANEYSLEIESKKLKKLYEFCTDKKENFMLIDVDCAKTRYRKNFSFIISIDSL